MVPLLSWSAFWLPGSQTSSTSCCSSPALLKLLVNRGSLWSHAHTTTLHLGGNLNSPIYVSKGSDFSASMKGLSFAYWRLLSLCWTMNKDGKIVGTWYSNCIRNTSGTGWISKHIPPSFPWYGLLHWKHSSWWQRENWERNTHPTSVPVWMGNISTYLRGGGVLQNALESSRKHWKLHLCSWTTHVQSHECFATLFFSPVAEILDHGLILETGICFLWYLNAAIYQQKENNHYL